MAICLSKGQKVDLTKGNAGLKNIIVGLGWDTNKYDGGSEFDLDILYEVDNMDDLYEDIELIAEAFKMLQYDYLGGSGSRGYGKVKFTDLYAETVIGQLDKSVEDKINDILSKVSQ